MRPGELQSSSTLAVRAPGQRDRAWILERLSEFLKYGAIGTLSVTLNYLIIDLVTVRLGLHYLVSIMVSCLTVTFISFWLNRAWTFDKLNGSVRGDLARYVVMTGCQYLIYAAAFAACVDILHTGYQLTAVSVSILLAPVNYLLHRRLSFQLRWLKRDAER